MFRAAHRSSSGALTVFAASGLHTHVVTGHSEFWVGTREFPLRLDYSRSPHAYVNQRLQIQLELPMTSGVPLETCSAFNEWWINKFYCKVASCWLFLQSVIYEYVHDRKLPCHPGRGYMIASCWLFPLSHITMHGSMNIKFINHNFTHFPVREISKDRNYRRAECICTMHRL